jgi:hypothetical protein
MEKVTLQAFVNRLKKLVLRLAVTPADIIRPLPCNIHAVRQYQKILPATVHVSSFFVEL